MLPTTSGGTRVRSNWRAAAILLAAAALAATGFALPGTASADTDGFTPCPNGTATMALQFAAPTVSVKAGATVPLPVVSAVCDGVVTPLDNRRLSYQVVSQPARVFLNEGLTTLETSDIGYGSTPATTVVSAGATAGSFTIEAVWGSFVYGYYSNPPPVTITGTVTGHLLGMAHPKYNVDVTLPGCTNRHLDNTKRCTASTVKALDVARKREHLGPVDLPSNWAKLSVPKQLLVMSNLERTARGLVPLAGLAKNLDTDAQVGAARDQDPPMKHLATVDDFANANWAGGDPNAAEADFEWMYDDGLDRDGNSTNGDCFPANTFGCWGHRDSILIGIAAPNNRQMSCYSPCAMGAGFAPTSYYRSTSYAEEFDLGSEGPQDPIVFSWASELHYLPPCERYGDTCKR